MQTLADLLPDIQRLGGREAIRWSNGFRTRTATYAELYGKIGAAAQFLDQHGIRKGDRVLIWGDNSLAWAAAFWACVARGVQAVPVDARFSPELVERIRAESQPKLVIDAAELDKIDVLPAVSRFTLTPVTPDDIVEIVYTSGTTGEPKGVVHRHRHLCSNLEPFRKEIAKYRNWARPFQPIRILDLLPLSHMFGQSQGLFIPLFLEGAAVFTTELHPAKLIDFVRRNRISVIVCVPRILESLKPHHTRFWKVRRQFGWKFWAFVVGGARVDPELEDFWRKLKYPVIQGYGLTEASPVVAVNHPFDMKTGSLGKVVEGQDVKIAPDGEILVRGESVTTTDGGWLHTGDLGEIDSEGRLYFRGRKKDMIVTPDGLNVHPEDVEAVLNSMPEVSASAVVGPDHVHAALILNGAVADSEVEAMIRRANERLESHQRIRTWSRWPNDDFPRTASTLKIRRHEVARQLQTHNVETPKKAALPDLGAMSSLERVELLSELETKYQVELDEDAFAQLKSTPELEAWLRRPEAAIAAEGEAPLSEWARSLPVRWFRNAFQRMIARPLYRHYLPLTVSGLENLEGLRAPVIFAANHISHLDVPTLYTALPNIWNQRLAPAMMKEHFRAYFDRHGRSFAEIFNAGISYFLACAIYNTYPLPQQMAGTRRALNYTADLINRGYCPIVFPEGHRTPDGEMKPFRPGIGMMAVRLRVPIVPIRLSGLYEIYSIHDSWPRRGPIHVAIGKPQLFPPDTSYEEAASTIQHVVEGL